MKLTITLEPQEVEAAIYEYIKKQEGLDQTEFYIKSLSAREYGSEGKGPEVTANIELGIPF